MLRFIFAATLGLTLGASTAFAQFQLSIAGYNVTAQRQERLGEHHWLLTGAVEIEQGDTKLYADEVEVFDDQNRALGRGNVVLTQANNRIAADHADFNTKTHLGTFYRAMGIATIQPPRPTPQPGGIVVPPISGQETDVYFFGETVEKIGEKKYKITDGGFSTCVQPTPRWNLTADTVVLKVDHYTLLRQAIFRVKDVPVFYLPVMYYPTKEDGRATGFLIPTYGTSTIRGQTIHTAFFWAINRSQDATILEDWFSKTGTGTGGEYRYNFGGGSDGQIQAYDLNQKKATYEQADGSSTTQPASTSYTINGGANQLFPGNLHARARVNYFSSITTNQTFSTNVTSAALSNRSYGANVVGAWRLYSLNATFDRNESFSNTTNSAVSGSSPRISLTRTERPLFPGAPVYLSFGSEVAHLDRLTKSGDGTVQGTTTDDRSLGRMDFTPGVRYPFKKWQWFTVNTAFSWRETFYTRSLDPATLQRAVDESLNRQYFTATAQFVGPTFTRVFDTPNNEYAQRFKHTIEPNLSVQRTSAIDNFSRIILIDGTDTVYGGTTTVAYGLSNRLYAKRKIGTSIQAQEIVAIDLTQSYYTNANASQYDPRYNTSFSTAAPNNFSPFALGARVTPSPSANATMRLEIDSKYRQLRTLSANGSYSVSQHFQTSVGWSHKFFIKDLTGFNDKTALDDYLNESATLRTRDNKYGVVQSLNYDILRKSMLQQRFSTFYNAQCCGVAFEYQRYNLSGVVSSVVPSDHRFFFSFTLAGLGNFSPFSGGLNGVPR